MAWLGGTARAGVIFFGCVGCAGHSASGGVPEATNGNPGVGGALQAVGRAGAPEAGGALADAPRAAGGAFVANSTGGAFVPALGGGDSGASEAGAGAPEAGASNETCSGPLDTLNELDELIESNPCPAVWCAATDWAGNCGALPASATATSAVECEGVVGVDLQLANGDVESCYYDRRVPWPRRDPPLLGVAFSSKLTHFCGGAYARIASSAAPAVCAGARRPLCDASTPQDTTPKPASCFDAFSGSCGACCPTPTPDCSREPEGYPNAGCVESENSYCPCACAQGEWSCAC